MRSNQAATQYGREVRGFAPEAMEALRRHDWPGNVRELVSAVRRAVVIGDATVVILADLTGLDEASPRAATDVVRPQPGSDAERTALLEALAGTHENITLTAQELRSLGPRYTGCCAVYSISLSRGRKAPPVVIEIPRRLTA